MSAISTTHAHARYPRLAINRLGLWLFIISESFLFAALLTSRYYLQGVNRPPEVNQALGLVITSILLLSSFFAYRAETFARFGAQAPFLRNTLATIACGAVFLFGVGYEWVEAFAHFPPSQSFGTVFFTLTGMHALHVLSGVSLLALLYRLGKRRQFSAKEYWPVEGVVKYWHFVDVVWVFIYPTLYLVG